VADGQKIKIHCVRIYHLRRCHVVFRRASRIAYIYRRAEFFYGGLTGPVVMGFRHINECIGLKVTRPFWEGQLSPLNPQRSNNE
jgi:hypothetical protein